MKRWLLALLLVASTLARAQTAQTAAVCHVDYGGEVRRIEAPPTDAPYAVRGTEVGSYFLFRVVFERAVAIKTYVYANHDDGPAPLHQAVFPYPPPKGGTYGFTGLQFVYEPVRDGELKFWCELR